MAASWLVILPVPLAALIEEHTSARRYANQLPLVSCALSPMHFMARYSKAVPFHWPPSGCLIYVAHTSRFEKERHHHSQPLRQQQSSAHQNPLSSLCSLVREQCHPFGPLGKRHTDEAKRGLAAISLYRYLHLIDFASGKQLTCLGLLARTRKSVTALLKYLLIRLF